MPAEPTRDIWVFADIRSRRLLDFSLNILCKGRQLATSSGGRVVAVLLTPTGGAPLSMSEGDACVLTESAEASCLNHGANRVLVLENDEFGSPRPDLFAAALTDAVTSHRPRLVLTAMTDFGRELAARMAQRCQAGLIADCQDVHIDAGGRIIGACPAWGGAASLQKLPLRKAGVPVLPPCSPTAARPNPSTNRPEKFCDSPSAPCRQRRHFA